MVTIQVEKNYRGDCNGKALVLVPFAVSGTSDLSGGETLEYLAVGIEGIFMMKPYSTEDSVTINDSTLYISELADYGFIDGQRFAFLETSNGLIFDRITYSSIADALTLNEIDAYLKNRMSE